MQRSSLVIVTNHLAATISGSRCRTGIRVTEPSGSALCLGMSLIKNLLGTQKIVVNQTPLVTFLIPMKDGVSGFGKQIQSAAGIVIVR
jgi:hypothetical protein